MRKIFYDFLYQSVNNKSGSSFYLVSEKKGIFINEVKEAKCVKEKQTVHYRRLKRYVIPNVGGKEKLIAPLSIEKIEMVFYAFLEELFSVIHEVHMSIGLDG